MSRTVWNALLNATRTTYMRSDALQAFSPFPDDLTSQPVDAYPIPCAKLMAGETGLTCDKNSDLRDAFLKAGPYAHWRETYKDTDIGQDFMDRFGCFSLIGAGGAFMSSTLWAWVVYMPKRLFYPLHHHPGEELYYVIAGEAEFMRDGQPNEVLREGDTSEHASNQPHAMETHAHPVMCLVVWRNGFETPPVLTE